MGENVMSYVIKSKSLFGGKKEQIIDSKNIYEALKKAEKKCKPFEKIYEIFEIYEVER